MKKSKKNKGAKKVKNTMKSSMKTNAKNATTKNVAIKTTTTENATTKAAKTAKTTTAKVAEPKNPPVLAIKNLAYRYADAEPDEYVLKNLNYEFRPGLVYAIKGRSGSGKTTLLSLLSGLEKNYEGSITFNEKELSSIDLDFYRSHNIGIIFQSYNLLPHLTAAENIVLSMEISGSEIENYEAEAVELMEAVGLKPSQKNRRVLKLSGGEQQRVAIARSLSYDPQIVLADEPTGNLDRATENEILEIFKELAHRDKKCVIIVTHSENVCDNADFVFELKKI